MFVSGHALDLASCMTTLIISNEKMNDIIKIVKSLEESGLLIMKQIKILKWSKRTKGRIFLNVNMHLKW